jgi:hypothetical protein
MLKCGDSKFRINPLVTVISSGDLSKFRNDQSNKNKMKGSQLEIKNDSEVFIVHSSYGNETFESVLRQVIVVKKSMCPGAYRIIELFNKHQSWRQKATAKDSKEDDTDRWHKCAFMTGIDICNSYSKSKEGYMTLDSDSSQLLSAFAAAGALVAV